MYINLLVYINLSDTKKKLKREYCGAAEPGELKNLQPLWSTTRIIDGKVYESTNYLFIMIYMLCKPLPSLEWLKLINLGES